MEWNRDCRSFPGIYSCDIMTAENYESCQECNFYDPINKKILIMKLGAIGDVIRTTTILSAIKEKYGPSSKITWLVSEESREVLKNSLYIDQILTYSPDSILRIQQENFDVLFSLEISPPATNLANLVNAKEKYGFFFDKDGHPSCFNKESEPYLLTVFSNKINKQTKKTYQEMLFQICNLEYKQQLYTVSLSDEERSYADNFLKGNTNKLIGINVGAGGRWVSKSWHQDRIIELVKKIHAKKTYKVILLGGKQEDALKKEIASKLEKENIQVLQNDSNNSVKQYMSIINKCDIIITNDSLALHLAIACNKKTIALFFCTPPWQIETYNIVTLLSSPLLDQHFMSDIYSEELVKSISANQVLSQI